VKEITLGRLSTPKIKNHVLKSVKAQAPPMQYQMTALPVASRKQITRTKNKAHTTAMVG
jgi:hypothetical protein